MTKKEACAYLGCRERALATYIKNHKIPVGYVKGKNGLLADYKEEDIKNLKEKLAQPSFARMVKHQQETAIANRASELVPQLEKIGNQLEKLITISIKQPRKEQTSKISLADKLLLSKSESALLISCSETQLQKFIDAGKLKSVLIGKSLRIKRSDLESFIKKLK